MAGDKATIRDCGYSGQILDFVYDELAGSAKMAFEGHLSQCSSCTEDVADLSSTSMAVRHWRAVEFDPLGALGFELPRGLEARPSLAASILAFFRQPLYAAAVATLLIGAAVGLYVLLGSPTRSQPAIATTDSPARVGSLVPKPILPVDEPETRVERDADEQIAATETKVPTPIRRNRAQPVRSTRPIRDLNDRMKDHAVASNDSGGKVVPEDLFGEVAETRDRSLRLTDLFAEDDED